MTVTMTVTKEIRYNAPPSIMLDNRAAMVVDWQVRPPQWQSHHRHATNAVATLHSSKACLTSNGGHKFGNNLLLKKQFFPSKSESKIYKPLVIMMHVQHILFFFKM